MSILLILMIPILYVAVGAKFARIRYAKQISEGRIPKNSLRKPVKHAYGCQSEQWTSPEYVEKYCTCGLTEKKREWDELYGHVAEVDGIASAVLGWPVLAIELYVKNGAKNKPDYLHIAQREKELF